MQSHQPKRAPKKKAANLAYFRDDATLASTFVNAWYSLLFVRLVTPLKDFITLFSDSALAVFKGIPLVHYFVMGLQLLHQGVEAIGDPTTPQRKTKIGVGILGGLMSVGLGIAGVLIVAGAIAAAPIVLPALAISVYLGMLYRDSYILNQTGKELKEVRSELAQYKNAVTSEDIEVYQKLKNRETELIAIEKKARRNVILNTVMVAALSIAFGAVFATGIGAVVLAGVAGALVVGFAVSKIVLRYQEKKQVKLQQKVTPVEPEKSAKKDHGVNQSNRKIVKLLKIKAPPIHEQAVELALIPVTSPKETPKRTLLPTMAIDLESKSAGDRESKGTPLKVR